MKKRLYIWPLVAATLAAGAVVGVGLMWGFASVPSALGSLLLLLAVAIVLLFVRAAVFGQHPKEPIILNLTLFGVAALLQVGLASSARTAGGFVLVAVLLAGAQWFSYKAQVKRTHDHLVSLFEARSVPEPERWATVGLSVAGVDFFPEYRLPKILEGLIGSGEARSQDRKRLIGLLPDAARQSLTTEALLVPKDDRQWRWRTYVGILLVTWLVLLAAMVGTA
ncbi:MAG TPA: hypothetical protein VGB83_07010 [Actinomycetota bacterium]